MSTANGKITAPVRQQADAAATLGLSTNALSFMMGNSHGKINKWSYHKPIRYNKTTGLTEDEFIGMLSDVYNGIYCGLKMGTNNGRITDLHDGTFEYYAPRGGAYGEYNRLGDMRGYDQNAVPTPTASIVSQISYGSDIGFSVTFSHNPNNTTGVTLAKWFELGVMMTTPVAFENTYLCALISTADRNSNAYIALRNWDTKTITPIKYNGSFVSHWYADCSVGKVPTFFNKATGTKMIVSLFLAPSLTPDGQYSPSSLESWTAGNGNSGFGNGDTANTPQGCIGVFNALALPATIYNVPVEANKPENKALYITGMTHNSQGVTLTWTRNDSNLTTVWLALNATAYPYGGHTANNKYTISANSGSWFISWDSLHLTGMDAGTSVTLTATTFRNSQTATNKILEQSWTILTTYAT